jgi:hypothetical protein
VATLYDIDARIAEAIEASTDPETGEILDTMLLESLQMERGEKLSNVIRWYKNESADAAAIETEIKVLRERAAAHKRRADRAESYIARATAGLPFSCPSGAVTYRKSTAVEVGEDFVRWARECGGEHLLRFKDPEPDKTAIKEALRVGKIPQMVQDSGTVRLVERSNMSIK